MNARRVWYILIVVFLIVLALPRMSQAASMFTASADYAADSPILYFAAQAHSGVQPAVKCPSIYACASAIPLPSIAARCGVTTTAIIKPTASIRRAFGRASGSTSRLQRRR